MTAAAHITTRPPLVRPRQGRIISGVAAGIGIHLGISPWYVRLALLVFPPVGVLLYVFLRFAIAAEDRATPGIPARRARLARQPASEPAPRRRMELPTALLVLAAVLVLGSVMGATPWLVPAILVLSGAGLAWSASGMPASRTVLMRVVGGALLATIGALVALGTVSFPHGISFDRVGSGLMVLIAVLCVVVLVIGPVAGNVFRDLTSEREARAREAERADIAAHLHDSVLQSLSLIRAHAHDPEEVTRLARSQERSLRTWLYEDRPEPGTSLIAEIREVAARVEDRHGVPIEVVAVGDVVPTSAITAITGAVGEALTNAVRHGAGPVSLYAEASARRVEAWVRDRGAGFDPENLPEDRMGLRESVIGRMTRAGGAAEIRSPLPTGGTEVHLTLPLAPVPASASPGGNL